MNLDELKIAWQEYDQKLNNTRTISEKIIVSMINERSKSRVAKVQRQYVYGFIYMLVWLFLCASVVIGNPFDFESSIQFIPMALLGLCFALILAAMVNAYQELQKVDINRENLEISLRKIIQVYHKPQKFLRWTVTVMFSASLLFPLSFLPRKIDKVGLWTGIGETLIPIIIALIVFFIATKFGVFKDRYGKYFQEDLSELKELKAISTELAEE